MSVWTATVMLVGGGVLTLPCPPWCGGHPHNTPLHPVDVLHESADTELQVTTGRGTVAVLGFGLAQAPFQDDQLPYGTVDLGSDGPVKLTPDQIRALADGLVRHSSRLRTFAGRLEELRARD